MRPEHGTSAGKPMLRCTSADGLTRYVRRRNQTSRGPCRRSSGADYAWVGMHVPVVDCAYGQEENQEKADEAEENCREEGKPMKQTSKKKLASKKRGTPKKTLMKKRAALKEAAVKRKAAGKKTAGAKTAGALKKSVKRKNQIGDTEPFAFEGLRPGPGAQSGDLQGLSNVEAVDSESVDELLEEGNAFEADAVTGVEHAGDTAEREVRTHEVPEDDVPDEYLDKE